MESREDKFTDNDIIFLISMILLNSVCIFTYTIKVLHKDIK